MGLHPLAPAGIDEYDLAHWRGYLAIERQFEKIENIATEKHAAGKNAEQEFQQVETLRMELEHAERRVRKSLRKIFERRTDVEMIGQPGEWQSPSETDHSIELLFDELKDEVKIFLGDQRVLASVLDALMTDRRYRGTAAQLCHLPNGTVEEIAAHMNHPRFHLYVELYFLRKRYSQCFPEWKALVTAENQGKRHQEVKDYLQCLEECTALRLNHCIQSRAVETRSNFTDLDVREDVWFEHMNVATWMERKPTVARGIGACAALIASLLSRKGLPRMPVPLLLGENCFRPLAETQDYEGYA